MDRIIDSHVHLDHIAHRHPDRIDWLREHRCAVVSWAWCPKPKNVEDLRDYLAGMQTTIQRLRNQGLCCGFLAGIHPRNITADLRPEEAIRLIKPFLADPLCLGVGEIGLEHDSQREKEILAAQLTLAPALAAAGKKIGIHTPRSDKATVTTALLSLLESIPEIKPITIIDHCSEQTLPAVLAAGYHAGITLSPIKTAWQALPAIVSRHTADIGRILCNTDSGTRFFEDLLLAARSGRVEPKIAKQIFYGNAARFFRMRQNETASIV